LEKAFQEALPKALRLLELTEEFLKQKEAERSAYWNTPERKAEREARWAEIRARYEK
jgi:carbamoylphosphate synthase large subunit